ncbi:MAG: histidinol-phosphate transaminase [Flavobacteriales bacterium]|nr:histidinol-phosphate transaminase [Flavobacteriales bacterium]
MFSLDKIIRNNVKSLKPYASARDEFKGREGIFLDANENPFGSLAGDGMNRYPDPLQRSVKEKIADWKAISTEHIFLGNGSDEIIDLLIRAFCEPREHNIIITPPTYGVYSVYAEINDVVVKKVLLDETFNLNVDQVLDAVNEQTRLIFLCSPNNPTGNIVPRETVINIAKDFPGLVVVDEAYADFSEQPSMVHLLNDLPNLFVMQTFSKAWGMAALRLGMGFANPDIVKVLNKIKPPYNINAITQELALKAMDRKSEAADWVQQIILERSDLAQQLRGLDVVKNVYPSEANFLLIKTTNAKKIYDYLTGRGIIVRNRSSEPGCAECLRVTVGTKDENIELIASMKEYSENLNP